MEQETESVIVRESNLSPTKSAQVSSGDSKDDTQTDNVTDKAEGNNKITVDALEQETIESNSKDSIDQNLEDISSCEDLITDSPEAIVKNTEADISQIEKSCINSSSNDPSPNVDDLYIAKDKSGTSNESESEPPPETCDAPENGDKINEEPPLKNTTTDKPDEVETAPTSSTSVDENPQLEDPPNSEPTVEDGNETELDASKQIEVTKPNPEPSIVDPEGQPKDIETEKPLNEPENTEFVQISQDKQDDSQIEGHPMDAEDPFGGDNLTSENVEPLENDSLTTENVNFRKLGDQADNLQDVVNAKDTNFKAQATTEDNAEAKNDPVETTETTVIESPVDESPVKGKDGAEVESTTDVIDSELNDKTSADKNESESTDSTNETNDGSKKNDETNVPMETEESQSDVLPGQDDELCIIPDNMKENTIINVEASDNASKDKANAEQIESSSNSPEESTILRNVLSNKNDAEIDEVTDKSNDTAPNQQDKDKEEVNSEVAVTDVIDIDDEIKNSEIEEIATKEKCKQCNVLENCNISVKVGNETFNVCSKTCKDAFTEANNKSMDIPSDGVNSKREKRCASCLLIVEADDERNLSWETMEFCNEECLGKFQTKYGSYCRNCNGSVQPISLGKYCVRFGYDVRQFCCSSCLEEFKKGLKVCSYCQKDISSGTEGFLAPVGDKGQFKDFCTQLCMQKYSKINSTEPPTEKKACSVCQEEKIVHCEVQIERSSPVAICSDPCFAAFKFVNKVDPDQCSTCKKFFELSSLSSSNKKSFVVFYEKEAHTFCNKTCLNIFIITNRKIVPCNWCKVKKYNFDMIKKELKSGQVLMMCSLNCLTLYQVSINAVSAKRINCDFCKEFSQAQYHLTMSDATIRNFCSYNCVMKFQGQYTKSPITIPASDDPVPTGTPKRTYPPAKPTNTAVQKPSEAPGKKTLPVISSVTSLASLTPNGQAPPTAQPSTINNATVATTVASAQVQTPQVIVKQQVITRPLSPVKIHNKVTQCKPVTHTKGVSVRPHPCVKSTQTDDELRAVIPIPVPIYVPFPVHMWSMPYPVPMPFPLPIPVPIFIPTTRNSAKGIFKEIKRIQEKIPADPFEAELLMMAEMVATEKKTNDSDSGSSDDNASEAVDSNNTFGEDMLQMALKMATGELDEPAVDLEAALTPNTITASQAQSQPESAIDADGQPERLISTTRGKKRMVPYKPRTTPSKRGRRISGAHDVPIMPPPESQPQSQPRIMEPIEKPDANMALKYTFGVNAWRQWVVCKNAELEKQITPSRKVKLFKTDLLQLTADELNYTLCLFVKEVRKPNGAEYAPDTIYYLCLGIQQYLFENNRIDNIFTDSYYEKFTDCLNDVAKKFSVLYNDAQYIVTRVEEEHLWECKQLGAHSPHVLLSTLMFFNTKHFNLVTVEEHMQLSFSHIMKHWKRNPAAQTAAVAGKVPSTRNVLLRFYPPQSALEANSRKKKVYEQQENEENPLRCPVKLYEFYLSKCPESVKTRNDVFYLLPERSCVPDSPVWYSTSPLAKEHLIKMLYRVKMVKEINVALLTS